VRRGSTNFPKPWSHFKNFGLQIGDKEDVPHLGPKNIRRHHTKIYSHRRPGARAICTPDVIAI
jgi:hypothetical protein